ncbi:hypothetical protein [Micromonospora sp. NPDC050200]|uniref:hypothetical protein n=1 Tax=Micromonospora sp. NPDC050200 TaxID=3155664 RepID=UPI0033E15C52
MYQTVPQSSSSALPANPAQVAADCWLSLAADLRQVADRIATLAGTDTRPASVNLAILGSVMEGDAERMVPLVDALAAAFGTTAAIGADGGRRRDQYRADPLVGGVKVCVYTYVPEPEDAEKAAMRAELDALRAQLAEGGTR